MAFIVTLLSLMPIWFVLPGLRSRALSCSRIIGRVAGYLRVSCPVLGYCSGLSSYVTVKTDELALDGDPSLYL